MPWYPAAASVAGSAHRKANLPCQDCAGFERIPPVAGGLAGVLGAVADGAGSVPFSETGAVLAVETALKQLKDDVWYAAPPSGEDAERIFARVHESVLAALTERAGAMGCPIEHLACTLLAFIATPAWTAAMQIGDGLMVLRAPERGYELLFKPDRGEYINETTFVTSPLSAEHRQICVWPHRNIFVCASTDGIERVCIRYEDWTPHPPFFAALEDYMKSKPDPEQGKKDIAEFLERGKLNDRTDDDKTLLLCFYTGD